MYPCYFHDNAGAGCKLASYNEIQLERTHYQYEVMCAAVIYSTIKSAPLFPFKNLSECC